MLAADVDIVDIDPAHWARWFELLVPQKVRVEPRWALVILERGRPLRVAVRGGDRGVSVDELPFAGTSPRDLRAVADALGVAAVVVIERAVLPAICAEIDGSLDMNADLVAQGLVVLRVLEQHSGRGLWSLPNLLDIVPDMSYDALQRTFDVLVPDGSSVLAYVFAASAAPGAPAASGASAASDRDPTPAGPAILASVIATKRRGSIDVVTTHRGVDDLVDHRSLTRDWRRHHREVTSAVAARYAPPSLACFADHRAFLRILTGPGDQMAREINARNLIIDPAPTWLLGLLGGATMAAFASRGARALARVLPRSARKMASDFAHTAEAVMRDSGAHPFALLGFDPIELWRSVRHFYRRDETPRDHRRDETPRDHRRDETRGNHRRDETRGNHRRDE